MRLYQGNAKKLVGKKIDCYRRTGGYYPMEIIELGGIPHVKDAIGVCMPIPEKEEDFNATNFDYAFQEVEVQENTMYQSLAYHQHETVREILCDKYGIEGDDVDEMIDEIICCLNNLKIF